MKERQKEILLSIQKNMENGMNFKDACSNASESTSYDRLARALLDGDVSNKSHGKKKSKLSNYSEKISDGFAYGVGFNTAQYVAPIVRKSVIKGAKRYADDHDFDMGYIAEFIEDHKYD